MAISESVELLGKGLYNNIPDVLTLSSIPTASELETVGNEDFDKTMLDVILPQAVKEDINFYDLLEIDYQWICRCLRLINYGPYHSTNAIFCDDCGSTSYGDYIVNLETVECKTLPPDFVNDIVISKSEFIDFKGDVHVKLPTIQDMLNARKDKAFQSADGESNTVLARMCYMISSINGKTNLTPPEIKLVIQDQMSSADYKILKGVVQEVADYGLRAAGTAQCPKCGSNNAVFLAFVDDRFFRPSMGALRKWKDDRNKRREEDIPSGEKADV